MIRIKPIFLIAGLSILLCAPLIAGGRQEKSGSASAALGGKKTTLAVWDYYGDPNASPLPTVIEAFEKENPDIKINYEIYDWDTTLEKMNVVLTSGTSPDVITVDMTWMPRLAALDALTDLKPLSGGLLNGEPLEKAYAPGALDAMKYKDKIVAMLYDFDVYVLYYRADLFERKELQPPKTWQDLVKVGRGLTEGEKYRYAYDSNQAFSVSQFIYENGGDILNSDDKSAVFNSAESVEAVKFYSDLFLKENIAIHWSAEEGEDFIPGIKDGRIAMFSNGPYYMGLLKSGAPEMAGMWKVAPHPYNKQPGSYLGGTGLVIPVYSKNPEAAWKFIEFAMRTENQIKVFEKAGAAPALTAALQGPELNAADPYFGNQKTFAVFLKAMETAHHLPYVRQWDDIDRAVSTALEEITLKKKNVKQALDDAAAATNEILKEK